MLKICFILTLFIFSAGSETMEDKLDIASANAKKGIYHALENIPEEKQSYNRDLITDTTLIAEVKLYKESHGVKIVSTGYYGTYSVEMTVYRSNESLAEDGYIENRF